MNWLKILSGLTRSAATPMTWPRALRIGSETLSKGTGAALPRLRSEITELPAAAWLKSCVLSMLPLTAIAGSVLIVTLPELSRRKAARSLLSARMSRLREVRAPASLAAGLPAAYATRAGSRDSTRVSACHCRSWSSMRAASSMECALRLSSCCRD